MHTIARIMCVSAGTALSGTIARRFGTVARLTIVACIALPITLAATATSAHAQSSPADSVRSTADGVYSGAQAARGETAFANTCGACHGVTEFSGPAFRRIWTGRTVYDLFDQLRATMPLDNPGGLPRQQYADVIAYLMKLNQYPAADVELPTTDADLRRVRFEP
jgi:S-disulfanyl-L-cysteine oxidoreductase SoxD